MLIAVACGLAVANVYYAYPLLDVIADSFGIAPTSIGIVVTVTQVGYGLGLLLLVPLGDVLNPRRLIVTQLLLSVVALVLVGAAWSPAVLLLGMAAVGMLAVVAQVLVAYAATLARPEERGRVIGAVTSGIVIGILLARTFAGLVTELEGWRTVYLTSAALTLTLTAALLRGLPADDRPRPRLRYWALVGSTLALYRDVSALRVRGTLAMLIFATSACSGRPWRSSSANRRCRCRTGRSERSGWPARPARWQRCAQAGWQIAGLVSAPRAWH